VDTGIQQLRFFMVHLICGNTVSGCYLENSGYPSEYTIRINRSAFDLEKEADSILSIKPEFKQQEDKAR
jgi:hypothetical protein